MQSLIRFWKQDIINKLIVIVASALALGIFAILWLVVKMPEGRSLSEAFSELMPSATPTFDINSLLTKSAPTAASKPPTEIPTFFLPTFTSVPLQPTFTAQAMILETETPTSAPTLEPTQTFTPIAATPTVFVPPTSTVSPTQASVPAGPGELSCIPTNEQHKGKVVETLDGNTVRVLIDGGLIYVVRYIGVAAPTDNLNSVLAEQKNTELVYGKGREILLFQDKTDKDDRGRLLRYVLADGKFVNLEMIQLGLGAAHDVPPNSSCAQLFANAEQTARASKLGIWKLDPTPLPQFSPTP